MSEHPFNDALAELRRIRVVIDYTIHTLEALQDGNVRIVSRPLPNGEEEEKARKA